MNMRQEQAKMDRLPLDPEGPLIESKATQQSKHNDQQEQA
jgi:hypothetical protein